MKIAYFDSGFFLDDPNLRWGDPSYLLEPGDPGYVPPMSPVNEPKTKRKRMKRNAYYPIRQGDQVVWLVNLANKLPGLATALGLTPAQVTVAVADCLWLVYCMESWLPAARAWSLAATDAMAEAQTGVGSAALALPVFSPPALPTGVAAVNPGALTRIFALVQLIKDGGKCTEAIATNLGIIGSAQAGPDLATVKPELTPLLKGGQVIVKWGWGGHATYLDLCEIHVDRGDGKGFTLLTFDSTPNYTDTEALPATAAVWKYKAIYRVGDDRVGQWSEIVSLPVAA